MMVTQEKIERNRGMDREKLLEIERDWQLKIKKEIDG